MSSGVAVDSPEVRTLAPFGRRRAAILENAEVGAYRLLTALDVEGPADPRPGQFYMLAAEQRWGGGAGERPHLPRAFSFARVRPSPEGVELDFLLEDIGPGTERLSELEPGEALLLSGPLGAGFRPPTTPCSLLVGGGIGVAPILAWREDPRAAGGNGGMRTMLGFRSGLHAQVAGLMPHEGLVLATDDGSAGRHALVTELLEEQLGSPGGREATIYACGPPPMLEAVRAICASRGVAAQLALESGMACGYGACFGCVVPTRLGPLRVCVDGPVIDAALLESALAPAHQ